MTSVPEALAALERVDDLARRVEALGIAAESAAVVERVREEQFFVACVGQFKRGKSTLIGALVGDQALPAGVTPTTAVPTMVRYGPERGARVRVGGDWRTIAVSDLDAYISEDSVLPAEGRAQIAELILPAPILANGMVLVDTPGLGSVFSASTEATRSFIPHIDVAVAVLGTDPPITGDELQLLADVANHVEHVLVVLNKSDRVSERERNEASAFARRVIEERLDKPVPTIYEVSATDQLSGRATWADWPALVNDLETLASADRTSLAAQAGTRAAWRLASELDSALALQQAALTEPIEQGARRIEALATLAEETRRALRDLTPLLGAREAELGAAFGKQAREFLDVVRPDAHHELGARLRDVHAWFGPTFRRLAMAAAQDVTRDVIARWRPTAEASAQKIYESATRRTVDMVSALCEKAVADSPADRQLVGSLPEAVRGFPIESAFRFNEQITIAQPASPLRFVADVFLAAVGAHRTIASNAHRFLDWLLDLNIGRAESDLIDRLRTGRQRLQTELGTSLERARTTAETSLARGVRLREGGRAEVERALARIAEARAEIMAIKQATVADRSSASS